MFALERNDIGKSNYNWTTWGGKFEVKRVHSLEQNTEWMYQRHQDSLRVFSVFLFTVRLIFQQPLHYTKKKVSCAVKMGYILHNFPLIVPCTEPKTVTHLLSLILKRDDTSNIHLCGYLWKKRQCRVRKYLTVSVVARTDLTSTSYFDLTRNMMTWLEAVASSTRVTHVWGPVQFCGSIAVPRRPVFSNAIWSQRQTVLLENGWDRCLHNIA